MSKMKYARWYYERYVQDEFVRISSMEVIGSYFTLLNSQMANGRITSDPKALRILLNSPNKKTFDRIWGEIDKYNKFVPLTEKWVSTGYGLDDGYWEIDPTLEPGFLHNKMLTKIMTIDKAAYESKKKGGQDGAYKREVNKTLSQAQKQAQGPSLNEESDSIQFDVKTILKEYPFRNDASGIEEGVELFHATITSQELYDEFRSAVKAYKRQCERDQTERKYIKKFSTFMCSWRAYLPKEYKAKSIEVTKGSKPPPIEPWKDTYNMSDKEIALLEKDWTDEMRQKWYDKVKEEQN